MHIQNRVSRTVVGIGLALAVSVCASADLITIDSFASPFESETFVGSYSGGIVGSTYEAPGLEIGYLYPGDGLSAGDPLPAPEHRASEVQSQSGLGDVLGGHRYGSLVAAPLDYSRVSVYAYEGWLSYSTAFGTRGILDLVYEGDGGLNTDLRTNDDDGRFEIELLSGDLHVDGYPQYDRPVPMDVIVKSGVGTPDEAMATVSTLLLLEELYTFDFADFTGIDFSDVDSIAIHIDQSDPSLDAVDFALGEFVATSESGFVPEPSSLGLLALGILAAWSRRSR